jgi:hypothetical protein
MIAVIKVWIPVLAIALILGLSASVWSQERPSVGVEFGGSETVASGAYTSCSCGRAFKSDSREWLWNSSLALFLPITEKFELGFGVGVRSLGASYTAQRADTVVVEDGMEYDTIGPINVSQHAEWGITYASMSVQLSRQVYYGLRSFAGGTMNLKQSSHERLERNLIDSTNIRFASTGTKQEVLSDDNLSSAKDVQWQSFLGLRYAFDLSPVLLLPTISAHADLTPALGAPNSKVRIVQFGASILALYVF